VLHSGRVLASSVTGVALGEASAAGESWNVGGSRRELTRVRVIGASVRTLRPRPAEDRSGDLERFDRQVLLFGAAGQARLRGLHVGVLGAGGGGSILIEQLAHLGIGQITAVDPDVVKRHNLSRIIGASERDARKKRKKVDVARDHAERIDPSIQFNAIDGDISHAHVAERLLDCDYLLLATDTATARLVANAIAQSFLIPLIQIGAKVELRGAGEIEQIYTAVRPVLPRHGCLSCAGLIDPVLLQREAATPEQRAQQNYLGQEDVADPSVTTLNAVAAAGALNALLMSVIGQADPYLAEHRITLTRALVVLHGAVFERCPEELVRHRGGRQARRSDLLCGGHQQLGLVRSPAVTDEVGGPHRKLLNGAEQASRVGECLDGGLEFLDSFGNR
jgi:ThiF family